MPERMKIGELLKTSERVRHKRTRARDKYRVKWKLSSGEAKEATGKKMTNLKNKVHLHTKSGHYVIDKGSIVEVKEI